jgi:hypothetical protein
MKLEPNSSTEIESTEKEGDGRHMEVSGNKPFVGQKGKTPKKAAPHRKGEKEMPPSKAKCKSVGNFLLYLNKCKSHLAGYCSMCMLTSSMDTKNYFSFW